MMPSASSTQKKDPSQGAYQKGKYIVDHIFMLMAITQQYLTRAGRGFYGALIDFR